MRDARLLFGPLAALIFLGGVLALAFFVPGYDAVRQTVSEIGEMGSPMRWPFAAILGLVALCLFVFSAAIWRASREPGVSVVSALCIAWMGIAAAAIGLFAFPHPLHNLFGISQLIAYQGPLAFALTWRRAPNDGGAIAFSWVMGALLYASLALNLSTLARDSALFEAIRPIFGLVQRSLFACFFIWCAGVGWLLWRRPERR